MRGRVKIAAIGAAAGVAIAVALAVSPASAAKPGGGGGAVTTAYSCATFEGLTSTQSSVVYSGVGLRAGESITARVSPAGAGDQISLSMSTGLSFTFYAADASQGITFVAPANGSYSLGWSLLPAGTAPAAVTWTFDCSSASGGGTTPVPSDADRDGAPDTADACPGTVLPDAVSKPLAGRYFADRAGQFIDGTGRSAGVTVVDAGGCSTLQIAKALRLSAKDSKSGIPLTTLTAWASSH
ncbi:hypothetical protein [Microbacterium atlanticum]|uniref:hypothetical protein n=1 Tax=Microbacterium atlanticum TaxID=2782168 RepID=UPI001888016A|nr:hypothetical protein [Microbacterium atlanticum]